MAKKVRHRLGEYSRDFIVNGAFGLTIFFALKFLFLFFSPVSWYFEYSAVEPVSVPVDIDQDYILMESDLVVRQEGSLTWNDVLRCRGENGSFNYIGQHDTRAATVVETDGYVKSRWEYQGTMPRNPALCRIDSTITRELRWGITKTQFIQSAIFQIQ